MDKMIQYAPVSWALQINTISVPASMSNPKIPTIYIPKNPNENFHSTPTQGWHISIYLAFDYLTKHKENLFPA